MGRGASNSARSNLVMTVTLADRATVQPVRIVLDSSNFHYRVVAQATTETTFDKCQKLHAKAGGAATGPVLQQRFTGPSHVPPPEGVHSEKGYGFHPDRLD